MSNTPTNDPDLLVCWGEKQGAIYNSTTPTDLVLTQEGAMKLLRFQRAQGGIWLQFQ